MLGFVKKIYQRSRNLFRTDAELITLAEKYKEAVDVIDLLHRTWLNVEQEASLLHNQSIKRIACLVAHMGGEVTIEADLVDLVCSDENLAVDFTRIESGEWVVKLVSSPSAEETASE